jgi:two-component system OmpR family response regulator
MDSEKKRILVTDDEPDIVDIITRMLESSGYDTIEAYSGEECLEKAVRYRPDLIFLDIMMKTMDGWEVASLLKRDPITRDIPVIMVTAVPLTLEDVMDRSSLIEDYIMKPVKEATLRDAIDNVFASRTRIERTLEMARKSGVGAEVIKKYENRYRRIYSQVARNRKLMMLISQIYSSEKVKSNPAYVNMLSSLRKGLQLQESELKRLETVLTTPVKES